MVSIRKRISRLLIAVLSVLLIAELIPLYRTGSNVFAESGSEVKTDEVLNVEEDADQEVSAGEILDEKGNTVEIDSIPADIKEPDGSKKDAKKLAKKKLQDGLEDFAEIDSETAAEISLGTTPCEISEGGATVTYKFMPESSGTYLFYSEGSVDTCGKISLWDDEAGEPVLVEQNGDGTDSNFSISFNATAGKTYYLQAKLYSNDTTGSFDLVLMKDEYSASLKVSLAKSTGIASVKGTVTGDQFDSLYVDGSYVSSFSGSKSLNMKDYSVGLHSIYVTLKNHPNIRVYYSKAVPTYIYSKTSNKLSYFTVGHNYFIYSYGGSSYSKDYNCGIMLEYRKKGSKKWKTGYGPYSTGTSVKTTKMKSAKKYQVRTYFAKAFTYGGKKYLIKGKDTGKPSKAVTFKTGGKKLKIKSAKISKVKVTSKMVYRGRPGWIWDPYYGRYNYGIKFGYEKETVTQFKITVKLKKKPNAKGIRIGNQVVKGNKKKYTKVFNLIGNQKGKKLKFSFCSYQSNTYKGYSPYVYKKIKIK